MSAEFDIIFAGGGTTACVVAGRLAAANPSLKILIVERGQHTRDLACHVQPCRYIEHLAPSSTTVFHHVSKPSPHLNGRTTVVQCGRSVGGGSTVNFMAYVRGAASDYDDWERLGNVGWNFAEVLPLIKKLETFTSISDRSTHGYSGPIQISTGGANFGIGKQFLDVARIYDPDRPQVDDHNDFRTANAYCPAYKYIDPVTGRRSDAASRYLYPQSDNPHLEIMVEKRVRRVIIENGRAAGIEYVSEEDGKESMIAMASRSGIGSPSVLERNSVPLSVDLPGVGENYQDHLGHCVAFYGSDGIETMDDIWNGSQPITERLHEWEANGTGKIAHNGIEAVLKVRPTAAQLTSAGPALQSRWETFFEHSPDKPLGVIGAFAGFPLDPSLSKLLDRKLFSTMYYLSYPESLGSVHITPGEDTNSPLEFDPRYFSKPGDIVELILLYKMARELARRMHTYRGEVAACHPKFPPGSLAACNETGGCASMDAPDIVYSDADDKAIANFLRDTASTSWHSLGTCAMKPRNQGGVVDARLNVYGVESLKVADMSICPTNVGNNTYSTALLIGEKAAVIIAEDLGLSLCA